MRVDDPRDDVPAQRPPHRRSRLARRAAGPLLATAAACAIALTIIPSGFVIEQPGPVFDTLGEVTDADGAQVPLIRVDGATTYPTSGSLDLLTVQVVGSPETRPYATDLAAAWLDPRRAIVPVEAVFPRGESSDRRDEVNAALMVDSQQEAAAAAFAYLGEPVSASVTVRAVAEGSPAAGALVPGDAIEAVDGEPVADAEQVRSVVDAARGEPVIVTVTRDGALLSVPVTPEQDAGGAWLLGITVQAEYVTPYPVVFALPGVGGPSAGMMFALAIVDLLTPGALTGGEAVAGTGTISADGEVGPIGGIRQKMWGARDAGAAYFLAPLANCDEVAGHAPDGLRVIAVSTLDEAVEALGSVAADGGSDLPGCPPDIAVAGHSPSPAS